MGLQIRQDRRGTVRILILVGRLDTETAADLELTVQDLLGAKERHFVIDLGGVSYVSSAGLRVLLMLAKELDAGRGSLRLAALGSSVAQVFDVAGFTQLFAIFPDAASALREHPEAKLDPDLVDAVAKLLNAETSSPDDNGNDQTELARRANALLGAPNASPSSSQKPRAAAAPTASAAAQRSGPASPAATEKRPGLVSKLRGLFGGKR